MSLGLISVLLILFVVIGAIATKRVEICLFLACLIGAIVLYGTHALPELGGIFVEAFGNNAWVMLIVLLLGGFIALLQSSNGHARVRGESIVYVNAKVYGDATVFGNALVNGDAMVYGNAMVYGDAEIYGNAMIFDNAMVYGNTQVCGNAVVFGCAKVFDDARVFGSARVNGNAAIIVGT